MEEKYEKKKSTCSTGIPNRLGRRYQSTLGLHYNHLISIFETFGRDCHRDMNTSSGLIEEGTCKHACMRLVTTIRVNKTLF